MDFLIGTLTRMGGAGIGRVRLENDRLRLLWTNGSLTDPNWQSLGPNGRIFSVSSDMPEPMRGCVNELKISETGMDVISRQATEGNGPCALSFSADGRSLLCANYGTGSLTVFPLTQKGIGPCRQRIQHEGRGPHPTRQAGPHIHQVTRIPTLPCSFCVVDLGIDALVVYHQAEDGSLSERYRICSRRSRAAAHGIYAGRKRLSGNGTGQQDLCRGFRRKTGPDLRTRRFHTGGRTNAQYRRRPLAIGGWKVALCLQPGRWHSCALCAAFPAPGCFLSPGRQGAA